jgi:hypothetical protein
MLPLETKAVMPPSIPSKNQLASLTESSELYAVYVIQVWKYLSKVNEPIFFLERLANPQLSKIIGF